MPTRASWPGAGGRRGAAAPPARAARGQRGLVEGPPLLRAPEADAHVVRLDFALQRQEGSLRAAALRRVQAAQRRR